jgi:hypothetical protein
LAVNQSAGTILSSELRGWGMKKEEEEKVEEMQQQRLTEAQALWTEQ